MEVDSRTWAHLSLAKTALAIERYRLAEGKIPQQLANLVPKYLAEVPDDPGVTLPEVTFEATVDDGHRIQVVAILVDNVRTAGAEFDDIVSGQADAVTGVDHVDQSG